MSETLAKMQSDWQFLFNCALGQSVTAWAGLELVVDLNVHVIMKHYGGKSISAQVPMALNKKLTFLRRAFSSLHSLERFRASALPDIEAIAKLGDERHAIIHGAALQYLGYSADGVARFGTFKLSFDKKTEHELVVGEIGVDEVRAFGDRAAALSNRQVALGKEKR